MYEHFGRYFIQIQDRDTGEVKEFFWDYPELYPEKAIIYYWTEGNGSCDCNRGLEFYRTRDNDDPEFPCGTERMCLLGIWREDGTQIVESEV